MRKELIKEMHEFAMKIMKKENPHPQEIAVLPELTKILLDLPEEEYPAGDN